MLERESGGLESLQRRDRDACEAFVEAHYRGVHRFFLWLTHEAETAADLTQESFAAFWQSVDHLDSALVPDLKSWLYGIARNRWRKWSRDRRPTPEPLEAAHEIVDVAPGPEALAIDALDRETMVGALSRLPVDYQEALALRVFQELSYRQVADALMIREELARWRVHRARSLLRKLLDEVRKKEESGAREP